MTPPMAQRLEAGSFLALRARDDAGWTIYEYADVADEVMTPVATVPDHAVPWLYALATLMATETAKKKPARRPRAKKGRAR